MPAQEDPLAANPYRDAFYNRQAQWHGYQSAEVAEAMHRKRVKYYAWYTQGWLPKQRSTPILDIGCGSGQFLYFLREQGYHDVRGIDLDRDQVELGRELGLDATAVDALDFL